LTNVLKKTESDSEKSGEGTGSESESESEGVESLGGLGDKTKEGKDETEAATKLLATVESLTLFTPLACTLLERRRS